MLIEPRSKTILYWQYSPLQSYFDLTKFQNTTIKTIVKNRNTVITDHISEEQALSAYFTFIKGITENEDLIRNPSNRFLLKYHRYLTETGIQRYLNNIGSEFYNRPTDNRSAITLCIDLNTENRYNANKTYLWCNKVYLAAENKFCDYNIPFTFTRDEYNLELLHSEEYNYEFAFHRISNYLFQYNLGFKNVGMD
jgi:hypothetical protein